MERETRNHYHTRGSTRGSNTNSNNNNSNTNGLSSATERDLLLQWGNRKRGRCIKTQRKDEQQDANKPPVAGGPDRRVLRRASPNYHRVVRNTEETGSAMRGTAQHNQHGNGVRGVASQDKDRAAKSAAGNGGSSAPASADDKKGSSSGSDATVWPKFAISLTNKEKEEDFLVFKGSKLPQRPKKRAKVIQRTINLVSPGLWLCDLTLERYEVREKKISKKRPRGLKAMQNMESDSE